MEREILPHERDLRLWLQRRFVSAGDVEDIVQECYCSLAQLSDVSHIEVPRAYLFATARNLAQRQRKRATVVRLEPLSGIAPEELQSDLPSPERVANARQQVSRLNDALISLSERARRIFILRKVEGLSQKEIAAMLGVSEAVVENDASRSLRTVLKILAEPASETGTATNPHRASHARSR